MTTDGHHSALHLPLLATKPASQLPIILGPLGWTSFFQPLSLFLSSLKSINSLFFIQNRSTKNRNKWYLYVNKSKAKTVDVSASTGDPQRGKSSTDRPSTYCPPHQCYDSLLSGGPSTILAAAESFSGSCDCWHGQKHTQGLRCWEKTNKLKQDYSPEIRGQTHAITFQPLPHTVTQPWQHTLRFKYDPESYIVGVFIKSWSGMQHVDVWRPNKREVETLKLPERGLSDVNLDCWIRTLKCIPLQLSANSNNNFKITMLSALMMHLSGAKVNRSCWCAKIRRRNGRWDPESNQGLIEHLPSAASLASCFIAASIHYLDVLRSTSCWRLCSRCTSSTNHCWKPHKGLSFRAMVLL